MNGFIEHNETLIRLGIFAGVFVLMAGLEAAFPRKARTQPFLTRWVTNLGIVVIYSVLVRLVFPIAAMGSAVFAASKGWGVLNMVDLPFWLQFIISVIVLDFAVYWQHVAAHKIPIIWAIHKMHHADRDLDVTTGSRFHPFEIALSMLYKMLVILMLGPVVIGVFVFELILSSFAMFNHANVKLPLWLDRVLRTVIVTPDMHRVHHSVIKGETDSNYGFFLAGWDRIFGSYIAQPQAGHDDMIIGLKPYQTDHPSHLLWCLALPFKR